MTNPPEVILIGGFCEIYELCLSAGVSIVGVIDTHPEVVDGYDLTYLGSDEVLLEGTIDYRHIPLLAVPDAPVTRKKIFERYSEKGFSFATLISPLATVSPKATLKEGIVIQSGCFVSANVNLGKGCKFNVGANIFHDCTVGDFVTVAPSANVLGHVHVKELSYVGASATILPYVKIHEQTTIGAGAIMTKDSDAGCGVYVGNPAKRTV